MAINPMITHGETFGRIVPTETQSVIMGPRNTNSVNEDADQGLVKVQFQISRRSGSAYRALSACTDKCEST